MNKNLVPGQMSLVEMKVENRGEKVFKNILRERLEVYGTEQMVDEEILSLLTGIDITLVREGVDKFGLADLIKYGAALPITKVQRNKLELVYLLHKRLLKAEFKDKPVLNSSRAAGDYCAALLQGKIYESFYILCLDSQNRLNGAVETNSGSINESVVYPRLVVENALKFNANSVIFCHNHPGGSLKPSSADIDLTAKLKIALSCINIRVNDHVIVAGRGMFYSFAENGLL